MSPVTLKEFLKGGFPRSGNCYVRTHIYFTRVNKIEAMYRQCIGNGRA